MMVAKRYLVFQGFGGVVLGFVVHAILTKVWVFLESIPWQMTFIALFAVFAFGTVYVIAEGVFYETIKSIRKPKPKDRYMIVQTSNGPKRTKIEYHPPANSVDPETEKKARRAFWLSFLVALTASFAASAILPDGVI